MKKLTSTLALLCLLCASELKAQDYYRQFTLMDEQPGLDSAVSRGGNNDFIFVFSRVRQAGGVDKGRMTYFDGLDWYQSATFNYKGKGDRILYYQGQYYVSGAFRE